MDAVRSEPFHTTTSRTHLSLLEHGLVAEHSSEGRRVEGLRSLSITSILLVLDSSRDLICVWEEGQDVSVAPEVSRRHLVLRQGAGLVGADHGSRSKRLHGFEVLDEAVLAGHPLRGQREADLNRADSIKES